MAAGSVPLIKLAHAGEAAETVGEALLAMLKRKGIDFLFINAGTDHASIAEAYARQPQSGLDLPRPVIGTHENLVTSMAHGHTMVSGRIQAVMVHVSVGAANAVCAVMNARRDEIPMLFMAGRTPLFEDGRLGCRSGAIHWSQEMYDQAGMLRELVKWDYELRGGLNLSDVLDRGLAIAQAAPAGPVYLTLPREVLAETNDAVLDQAPPVVPTKPAPDAASVETLAAMIEAARCPILITSASGRDPATVEPLADLCETYGIGVVEAKSRYVCVPAQHPFHLGQSVHPYFGDADLLICLESDVPWIPRAAKPAEGASIVHIGADPLFGDLPIRSFGGDVFITCSTATLLIPLAERLAVVATDAACALRRQSLGALAISRAERRRKRLEPLLAAPRMTKDWLNHCLNGALPDDAILVNEYWLDREILDMNRPGSFFMHSPAAGLGWGLPAAIGAALAAPHRPVVCAHGDGSYIFANPSACHHAMAMHDAPVLTIVCNNARWGAVQSSTLDVYPSGHAARGSKPTPLSDLRPIPDLERYVEASGGHGEKVTDPLTLPTAIRRGLAIVRNERRQVVLNVICE